MVALIKNLWFDTETTGLDPKLNSIIEFGGLIEIDNKIVDETVIYMAPLPGSMISPEALLVHGLSYDTVMNAPHAEEGYGVITQFFAGHCDKFDKSDKYTIYGFNPNFDIAFLSQLADTLGDPYIGSYIDRRRVVDVRSLAVLAEARGLIPRLENYKLTTLAEHFKIPLNAHSALDDIKVTRIILRDYLEPLLFPKTKCRKCNEAVIIDTKNYFCEACFKRMVKHES